MAYFADLTPYTYPYGDPEGPNVVNVGWLSKDAPFSVGDVPADFANRLAQLVLKPVRVFHGSHTCEFCPDIREGSRRLTPVGNGEIRVAGDGAVIYVAPVLVAHYVTVHRYQPPQAFIDAVMRVAVILVSRPGMKQESEPPWMTLVADSEVTEMPFQCVFVEDVSVDPMEIVPRVRKDVVVARNSAEASERALEVWEGTHSDDVIALINWYVFRLQ